MVESEHMLLRRYPAIRTRIPEELQQWLRPVFAVRALDTPDRGSMFDSVVNHCELTAIGLTFARYGAPITARVSQNNFFAQGFPISGRGEVRWNGHTVLVDHATGGIVGGPGSNARVSYDASFAHLMVKFPPAVLTRKLSALIGQPIDPPLQLIGRPGSNPVHLAGQRRLIRFLAEELDHADGLLPPAALAEIEQSIIVAYLMATEHNYSHWLKGTPLAAAPWQIRHAADYIEQNWDRPITIEALTQVTGTSARSLFHLFKRTYGVSPMVFVRKIRLRRAKSMLTNPTPQTSVTAVGVLCGFSNMGHFARNYHDAFGERPSETLKAHR